MKMDKSQYKDVYVFVEQREGVIQKVAIELLGKARELADSLNEKVVAMLLGYEVEGQAQELIAYGADVVLCADERELVQYNTEPYAQAITQIVRERKPSIVAPLLPVAITVFASGISWRSLPFSFSIITPLHSEPSSIISWH